MTRGRGGSGAEVSVNPNSDLRGGIFYPNLTPMNDSLVTQHLVWRIKDAKSRCLCGSLHFTRDYTSTPFQCSVLTLHSMECEVHLLRKSLFFVCLFFVVVFFFFFVVVFAFPRLPITLFWEKLKQTYFSECY